MKEDAQQQEKAKGGTEREKETERNVAQLHDNA